MWQFAYPPANQAIFNYKRYENSFVEWYCRNLIKRTPFNKLRNLPGYGKYRILLTLSDLLTLFHDAPEKVKSADYLVYHSERVLEGITPYIRKARKVDDTHSIIFKLGAIRHFLPCQWVQQHDLSWKDKKNEVIWRGATTNERYRNVFVKKYFSRYNIGFSSIKQYPELVQYIKPRIRVLDHLKYKFIVSLEGYDLASNLKWILASNSVPIMHKPTWVSWIMETKLKPYEHYLPLNEKMDNLEDLMQWTQDNDAECEHIAINGKKYMSQFLSEEKERQIQHKLLVSYAEKFKFNSANK